MLVAGAAAAESVRVATYNVGLSRAGPGLLLHELVQGPKPQLDAVLRVIRAVRPDVLLLTGFDHDLRGRALAAFQARLAEGPDGIDYPYAFQAPVNAGVVSGRDLDGDGLLMGPGDALGWGRFPGQGGMAIVVAAAARRRRARGASAGCSGARRRTPLLPVRVDGGPFPDAEGQAALRLSSRAHWDVPVLLPGGGRLHLLAANPTPPLFDGAERFNRRRNHDEIVLWARYLDGQALRDDAGRVAGPPAAPVVVLGDLNADPFDGDGMHEGIAAAARPSGAAGPRARQRRGGRGGGAGRGQRPPRRPGGARHRRLARRARPGQPPGRLRAALGGAPVAGAGVFWPEPGERMAAVAALASAHRLVWVDIALP